MKRASILAISIAAATVSFVVPSGPTGVRAQPTPRELPAFETAQPSAALGVNSSTPIATVWIERIAIKAPVYRGVTMKVFEKGVGYWPGTGLPGQVGNMVFGAHRVTSPAHFKRIDRLKIGDPILVKYNNKFFKYVVKKKQIVKPTDTWILSQAVLQPTLTLFACHPLGSTSHRYVVTAVLKK